MSVTLDGNTLTNIIDVLFSEVKNVSNLDWINQSVDIDVDIWSKKPLSIIYILRVTNAEKWILDQLLLACQKILLEDNIYDEDTYVWVRSINTKWEGHINWLYPWLIEIELVKVQQ